MNYSVKFTPELKNIIDHLDKSCESFMPSALEMITSTYKSAFKEKALRSAGFIQDQTLLYNTRDFNVAGVVQHAIMTKSGLAIEYVFDYIDNQPHHDSNYELIVYNMEDLFESGYGKYLKGFFDDDATQGTNIMLAIEDQSLGHDQYSTATSYYCHDYNEPVPLHNGLIA